VAGSLILPKDPAATEQVAAALSEHTTTGAKFERAAWDWAWNVTGAAEDDHAEADRVYLEVCEHTGRRPTDDEPTPAVQPPKRPAPKPTPKAQADGPQRPYAGEPNPGLIDLRQRFARVEPIDVPLIAIWKPTDGPLIGEVVGVEILEAKNRKGEWHRVLSLHDEDGRLVELWVTHTGLRALIRYLEKLHGRPIRGGDRLAVGSPGKSQTGGSRAPYIFTALIDWRD